MSQFMLYYLAWQEDDWLDEFLDYFPTVNAMVPTSKTLHMMREQSEQRVGDKAVMVLNAAHEHAESKAFLEQLQTDTVLPQYPLYIVGLCETEEAEWQRAYPQANIIIVRGFWVEFDFDAVMNQIKAEWGDQL